MPSFRTMYAGKRNNVAATVYVRMKKWIWARIRMVFVLRRLGSWAEFDMKFSEEAIYCSGISHGVDTTRTFINALRKQKR